MEPNLVRDIVSLEINVEKGYNAIPGAMAMPINSWADMRNALRQLKDTKVQEKFETVIIDTCDIAWDYCEQFILDLNDVDAINKVPYGGGYTQLAKEFDSTIRKILQLNYGLILISHATDKTFKDEQGNEFQQIVPTLNTRARNICSRTCDIIGYSRIVQKDNGEPVTRLYMRGTPRFIAGSRFKYTPKSIEFSYDNLVSAIGDAIDKQAEESGSELITDERSNLYTDTSVDLDFDTLMTQTKELISSIPGADDPRGESEEGKRFKKYWQPRITYVIEQNLGKGKKLKDATFNQVEAIALIIDDLKELIEKNK